MSSTIYRSEDDIRNLIEDWFASAGSISIITDDDADTYITVEESADEDKIRFDTKGTEAMIIDDSQQVGIGTTSPLYQVDSRAGSGSSGIEDCFAAMHDQPSTAGDGGAILFGGELSGNNWPMGRIGAVNEPGGSGLGGALVFHTKNDSGDYLLTEVTEKMRITYDGNVGIGTDSPDSELNIESSGPILTFTHSSGANQATNGEIFYKENVASGMKIKYDGSANKMYFVGRASSVDTTLMTIERTGDVGIGTDNPGNALDIITGAATGAAVHIGETDNEGAYITSTTDNQCNIAGGVELASSSWTARSTEASLINLINGYTIFYNDDSLTDGNTYSPTESMRIEPDGDVLLRKQLKIEGASRVSVRVSGTQSINSGSYIVIQYDTEDYDNLSEYDAATNYRFQPAQDGHYFVSAAALFDAASFTAGNYIDIALHKNGTRDFTFLFQEVQANVTAYFHLVGSTVISLTSSDYIDIRAYHNAGTARNLSASTAHSYLIIHRLS